jgi:hypothetical protein
MGAVVSSTVRRQRPGRAHRSGVVRGVVVVLLLAACAAVPARGATTTERSASILIFPKVVFDGSRDTLIQISNTSNSMVHAECFYVNAAPLCLGIGDCLAGTCSGTCTPQWVETDFTLVLTSQQPTHWGVGSGRIDDPFAPPCNWGSTPPVVDCDDAGLLVGRIPPVSSIPFAGELRCIEVDQSGAPISGNHLKGEATIVSTDGDATKYNAVGLLGEPFTNDGDNLLCLGGGVTDDCPSGAEYEGCGNRLILDHFAEHADDPLLGPTSQVRTELTLVPCRADFEQQLPTTVTVQFQVFNEFETVFSGSTPVTCWRSFFLDDVQNIFDVGALQSRFAETQIRVSASADSGVVGVSEEYHRLGSAQARVAYNLHEQGTRAQTDLIFLPGEQ